MMPFSLWIFKFTFKFYFRQIYYRYSFIIYCRNTKFALEHDLQNNTDDTLTSVLRSLYAASQQAFLDLTPHSHCLMHPSLEI